MTTVDRAPAARGAPTARIAGRRRRRAARRRCTTYRVGGPRRCSSRRARVDELRAVADAVARYGAAGAGHRPRLQPARRRRRRSRRSSCRLAELCRRHRHRRRRDVARRLGGRPARAGPAHRRRRAHRVRVGRRRAGHDRWGGADERRRARLRHGRLHRPRCELFDLRDAHGRVGRRPTRSACASAARTSPTTTSSLDAELQLAHGDVRRGEREIAEIVRWRREHQPGGQNAGSVFVNPVPGELVGGGADRSARSARVPHRRGVRVGEARQLHPGRRRRHGRRRAGRHRASPRPRRRGDRLRTAQRGAPGRLRRQRRRSRR